MPLVNAPNGDVYDLPEATASGLVNSHDSGWSYVEDKPAPAKRSAAKSEPAKK